MNNPFKAVHREIQEDNNGRHFRCVVFEKGQIRRLGCMKTFDNGVIYSLLTDKAAKKIKRFKLKTLIKCKNVNKSKMCFKKL